MENSINSKVYRLISLISTDAGNYVKNAHINQTLTLVTMKNQIKIMVHFVSLRTKIISSHLRLLLITAMMKHY